MLPGVILVGDVPVAVNTRSKVFFSIPVREGSHGRLCSCDWQYLFQEVLLVGGVLVVVGGEEGGVPLDH